MSKGGPEAVDVENEPWEPLQPYLTGGASGNAGPNFGAPVPLNYNWLDWAQQIGGGMPSNAPPMSMNDPRMTFDNVHTPYQGGPWGYGMGPGQLTTEAGIPGQQELPGGGGMGAGGKFGFGSNGGQPPGIGGNFVQPPPGFTPGAVNQPPPVDQGGGMGGGMDLSQLAQAMQMAKRSQSMQSFREDGTSQGVSDLQALRWLGQNPGQSDSTDAQYWMAKMMGGYPNGG